MLNGFRRAAKPQFTQVSESKTITVSDDVANDEELSVDEEDMYQPPVTEAPEADLSDVFMTPDDVCFEK